MAVADPQALRVEVRRVITRPVAEVYRAWTDPACIAEWISPGVRATRVEADVRVDGRLFIEVAGPTGTWRLDGRYVEVVPNRRLKFTWITNDCPAAIHSVVTVDFTDLGGRTELVLLHTGFPDQKTRDDHDATGWQQIFDLLVLAGKFALTARALGEAFIEMEKTRRL